MNPLYLPEILEHISGFVPAWSFSLFNDSYLFTPLDLLACSLVSRTWYCIFYPHLWKIYDSESMSFSRQTSRGYYLVPEQLLIAQSPNFRILTNFIPRFSGILQCRQLVDLTLHRTCPRSLHLVRTNPSLKRLTWFGAVPYSGVLSVLESDSMSNLVCLEDLSLHQWDVSAGKLFPILQRNCMTLKRLTLKFIQGFDTIIDSTAEYDMQDGKCEKESIYSKARMTMTTPPPPLVLEQLKELTIDYEWPENLALLDLITKCCPKLEKLSLSEAIVDDTTMMAQLEDRLKETHPLLQKCHRQGGASGHHYRLAA
ncbi:hypothetical protein BGX27_002178 [Mortierella sp. AM989]|nr:hypothetical protein BGX27_002178 [Mortierella sp. AM989]